MRSVSVSKLKAQLSAYLAMVKAGEEVLVTDRNKSVAKLVPVPPSTDDWARWEEMERQGIVRLPKVRPTPEWWEEFNKLPMGDDPDDLALKALIADRDEER